LASPTLFHFQLLRPSSFACPHYQKLKKAVKEELEDELMPKYKELAESLRPVLNMPEEQPVKLRSITELKSIQMEASKGGHLK
jgi:hypothetical protein